MRSPHPVRPLAAVLAAALLVACAALDGKPRASQEERRAFAEALTWLPDDPGTATARLETFLRTWPESPLADDAAYRLGTIAMSRDDPETARRWYRRVVERHPDAELSDPARVRLARLELARGDLEAAGDALRRVRFSRLDRDERRDAFRVLADTSGDDPVEALRWLARLRAEEEEDEAVARVDQRIDALLRQLSPEDHERAADQIGRRVPGARVLISAAEQALDTGDLARARRALDRADSLPLAPAYADRLAGAHERVRLQEEGPRIMAELPTFSELGGAAALPTAGARGTVGVVLPLTGRFAAFGERSLEGVLLAADLFGAVPEWAREDRDAGSSEDASGSEGSSSGWEAEPLYRDDAFDRWDDEGLPPVDAPGRPAVRLLIRDSGGDPERAAAAVRELASRRDVAAIVGPLVSAESEAAAVEAEAQGIPLLALHAREEIASGRRQVFRVRTTPREEVDVIVEHAMGELGARRFAILYPKDSYGRGLRRLFWEAVEQRGGSVVGVAGYDPKATDFAEPIRRLVGYSLLTPEEKQALAERQEMLDRARRLPADQARALRARARELRGPDGRPLPPVVDFDALFIPESHRKVVLIAPQLAFHEAVGMRLLGPSGWYDADLVRIGRKHVRGAVFASQFFPESETPFVRDFAERYRAVFEHSPDGFAATAFDATNLVLVQLARGFESREAVREGILSLRGYPGASGVLSMGSDGNARKRPFLLTVEREGIVQIEQ